MCRLWAYVPGKAEYCAHELTPFIGRIAVGMARQGSTFSSRGTTSGDGGATFYTTG